MKRFQTGRIVATVAMALLLAGTIGVAAANQIPVRSGEQSVDQWAGAKSASTFDITRYQPKQSYASFSELQVDYESKYAAYLKELPDYRQEDLSAIDQQFQVQMIQAFEQKRAAFPQPKKAASVRSDTAKKTDMLQQLKIIRADEAQAVEEFQRRQEEDSKVNSPRLPYTKKLLASSLYRQKRLKEISDRLNAGEITWQTAQEEYIAMVQTGEQMVQGDEYQEVSVYPLIAD